jgi:HK97 family phage major capsid protein
MEEALKKMLAELGQTVKALHETITAKSTAQTEQRTAETDALVEKINTLEKAMKALQSPAVRKMVWAKAGTPVEEGAEKLNFGRFLKAVAEKDNRFLAEVKASSGQNEATNADGGFAVPIEFASEIIKLERQNSIARQLARIFPMGSKTRTIPKELAKPSVSWVGEGVEPTLTKGTLDQVTQTAKKLIAILPFSEEFMEDEGVDYNSFIAEVVAQEMGREEDKQAFVGDVSGLSDPFNGVFFASGVNTVTMDGADLSYADLVNLLMAPRAPYRGRGRFVLSSTALKKVMKLVDDNNRPLWSAPIDGAPGRILGKMYDETDQIPDTLGTTRTNGTNTALLFGAWDGLWISPRGGYTVKASDSASDSNGKSAFSLDEVWFKFRRRQDISVANGEALAKLAIPAA